MFDTSERSARQRIRPASRARRAQRGGRARGMREVRVALLEADVALPVARDFVEQVTEKAVGQEVLRSVTPGQMVVKIVHDALVETLGAETAELNLAVSSARRDHDGRPAGVGQDHDDSQARQAAVGEGAQAGADGVARRRPPGCAGAAGGARAPGERRHAADRRWPAAGRYRQAGAAVGQAAGL